MNLHEQNILFFSRTMQVGGTERVILQLCKILKNKVNKIVVCSCGGINVEKLNEMGISHYLIADIEKKHPRTILSVIRTLKQIWEKENITVVHTHHRMAAFYTYITSLFYNIIFINTSHNTFYNKKWFTFIAYQKANLIACGEMVKRNLVNFFGIPKKRVTVIQNAVETFDGLVNPIKELVDWKEKGYTIIGNIGRLSEQKGMEYFIQSLKMVKAACPNIKYVIVGDGKDKEKLKDLAQELEILEDIIFLGYRSDIRNVMSQLDLIVLSSLWEGLPLTPLEAFSIGKTIVATAVDGTVEIVQDGENGYLVEPKNPEQIAEKIIRLIEYPEVRKQLEIKAKETYLEKFSFEQYARRIVEYYENL